SNPNWRIQRPLDNPNIRSFLTGVADGLNGNAPTEFDRINQDRAASGLSPLTQEGYKRYAGTPPAGDSNVIEFPQPRRPTTVREAAEQPWLEAGFPPNAVAGIMRRVGVESNFNPQALGDYVNGQPTSIGLYQHHEDRARALAQYLRQNNINTSDPIALA